MVSMDVKGVSWVGGMYQKFEALCVEVDEAIYEDTVKYVGNQMRNVGETVKKFYSEVMQDLLASPSLDSVKDKDAASEQRVKDSGAAKDTVNSGPCYSTEEQCTLKDSKSQCIKFISSARASFVDKDLKSGRRLVHRSPSDLSYSASSIKDFGEDSIHSGAWDEWDGAFSGCGDLICKDASALEESQGEGNGEDITGDIMEGFANPGVLQGSTKLISVGDVSAELDGTLNPLLAHEIRGGGADKEGGYLNGHLNNFKLEESCVLVDENEQISKPTPEVGQKSYKKKIKEVFSSRRWSKGKEDQDQLASWYDEQCCKRSVSTSISHIELQKSQTSETLESEWELL